MRRGERSVKVVRALAGLALGLTMGASMAFYGTVALAGDSCANLSEGRCSVKLATGIHMAYIETGPATGQPVILIHGLTDNIRSWTLAMDSLHALDPSLHILAIDLRGHGKSSMPPTADCAAAPESCFRTADFAADIVAFMKAKDIGKATLVGHSLGSFIVQEVALSHPDMVDRAVLVATSTTGVNNVALRDYVLKEPIEGSWKAALEAKGKTYPADFYELTPLDADPKAEEWIAKNWDVDPTADPAFLTPYIPETAAVRLGTWIGATKALLATDNAERLKDMSVPTLVMWATQDSIFLDADQVAVRQSLTEAVKRHGISAYWKPYGVLPLPVSGFQESDIGHSIQWSVHKTVAADIDAFIKTGAPTTDLVHSAPAPALTTYETGPGPAAVQHLGH